MQEVPASTRAAYRDILRLKAETLVMFRRMWEHVSPGWIAVSWTDVVSSYLPRILAAQRQAAVLGASYGADTLADLGGYVAPRGFVAVDSFVGVAPDGRDLDGLLYTPAVQSLTAIRDGATTWEAMSEGRRSLDRIGAVLISDTARLAASVDIAARPGVGYVRMLNPPSCDRCAILAGRVYRWNDGFLRHPHCDCVHVPATARQLAGAKAEGLVQDPYEYFQSLSELEQDRIFGRGNAQALRDGANISQVVNSKRGRRGMFTSEGTTKRGYAGQRLKPGQRRLTPDGIYRQAQRFSLSREKTLALLEEHGYIMPGGQNPLGSLRGQAVGYGEFGRGGTRRAASDAVTAARASGVRNPRSVYTMTAAERRVYEATRNWEEAQLGINPYSPSTIQLRQGVRPWSPSYRLTDRERAMIEDEYRAVLATNGQMFTASGESLAAIRGRLARARQRR